MQFREFLTTNSVIRGHPLCPCLLRCFLFVSFLYNRILSEYISLCVLCAPRGAPLHIQGSPSGFRRESSKLSWVAVLWLVVPPPTSPPISPATSSRVTERRLGDVDGSAQRVMDVADVDASVAWSWIFCSSTGSGSVCSHEGW